MFIDINTYVGHWPFRNIKNNTLQGLDQLAKPYGITHMVVANIHGFFYKDANVANLELLEELESYSGETTFLPLAIVNPAYPNWEKDAREMIAKGFCGFELVPLYHRYGLPKEDGTFDLEPAKSVFDLAEELDVPIRICSGIENFRGRSENDTYLNVSGANYYELLSYNRKVPVFATSFSPFACGKELTELLQERKNVFFDTTQMEPLRTPKLDKAYEIIGEEHLCFGSLSPFNYLETALLRTSIAPFTNFEAIQTNPAKAFKL